jgi:hypothetical protein
MQPVALLGNRVYAPATLFGTGGAAAVHLSFAAFGVDGPQ